MFWILDVPIDIKITVCKYFEMSVFFKFLALNCRKVREILSDFFLFPFEVKMVMVGISF